MYLPMTYAFNLLVGSDLVIYKHKNVSSDVINPNKYMLLTTYTTPREANTLYISIFIFCFKIHNFK